MFFGPRDIFEIKFISCQLRDRRLTLACSDYCVASRLRGLLRLVERERERERERENGVWSANAVVYFRGPLPLQVPLL